MVYGKRYMPTLFRSKKKTKVKGRWVEPMKCIEANYNGDEMVKEPYSELLLKGDKIARVRQETD